MSTTTGPGPVMVAVRSARQVGGSQANRLEALVDAALRVVGGPAGDVLEETDGPDLPLGAEVEPVPGAARHPDQVARLHLQRHHCALPGVDVEHAAAADDEADLVLVV